MGLDIGASVIKAAEIQMSGKGNILKKFGMIPVAPGAIEDGRIMDMPEVANTIRSLFKSLKIREKKSRYFHRRADSGDQDHQYRQGD